jgi:hypothetical protein
VQDAAYRELAAGVSESSGYAVAKAVERALAGCFATARARRRGSGSGARGLRGSVRSPALVEAPGSCGYRSTSAPTAVPAWDALNELERLDDEQLFEIGGVQALRSENLVQNRGKTLQIG